MTQLKGLESRPKHDQDLLAQCYGVEPRTLQDLGSHVTCALYELGNFGHAVHIRDLGFAFVSW